MRRVNRRGAVRLRRSERVIPHASWRSAQQGVEGETPGRGSREAGQGPRRRRAPDGQAATPTRRRAWASGRFGSTFVESRTRAGARGAAWEAAPAAIGARDPAGTRRRSRRDSLAAPDLARARTGGKDRAGRTALSLAATRWPRRGQLRTGDRPGRARWRCNRRVGRGLARCEFGRGRGRGPGVAAADR